MQVPPSCRDCNKGWAADEAHFWNVRVLAGEAPNITRRELWGTTILPSFGKVDWPKRVQDLIARMEPVTVAGS